MQAKVLVAIATAALFVAAPLSARTEQPKVDVGQLLEENRRLAEKLRSAEAELQKYKDKEAAAAASNSEAREIARLPPSTPKPEKTAGANPTDPAPATAETKDEQKDFLLTIGTKIWLTEWTTWRTPDVPKADRGINIQTLTSESSSAVSPIPTLTAVYKDFIFNGSYLSTTDYQFPSQSQVYDTVGTLGQHVPTKLEYQFSGSRQEWDIALGYQVLPNLIVTTGYKEIEQNFRTNSCTASLASGESYGCLSDFPGKVRVTYAGPTLGISGMAPSGVEGVRLYGSFVYGWLGANYRSTGAAATVDSVDYYFGELGLSYSRSLKEMLAFRPLSAATAYAGYRYQTYKSELPKTASGGNNPKDVVQGFVAGVNLTF